MAFDIKTARPISSASQKSKGFDLSTARPVQASRPKGLFSSGKLEPALVGGGQVVGSLLGGAAGGFATGPMAPLGMTGGAVTGGMLGAMGGKALNQFGQALESGQGIPLMKQAGDLAQTGTIAGATELAGPLLGAGARAIGSGLKTSARALTGVSKSAIDRVLARGADKVVREEFNSQTVPESVRTKVVNGVNQFRDSFQTTYRLGRQKLAEKIGLKYTQIGNAVKNLSTELVKARVSSPTVLSSKISKGINEDKALLSGVYSKVSALSRKAVPVQQVLDLIDEIDDLVKYDPSKVRVIGQNAERILKGLRKDLSKSVEVMVPGLRRLNQQYAPLRQLYDQIQPKLKDQVIDSTLSNLGKTANQFSLRELSAINKNLPKEAQFLDDVLDYVAGKEFFKESRFYRSPIAAAVGGGAGYGAGGIPGALAGSVAATAATSPKVLGEVMKGLQKAGQITAKSSAKREFARKLIRRIGPGITSGLIQNEKNQTN